MFKFVRIKRKSIRSGRRTQDIIKAKKIICYLYHKKGIPQRTIGLMVNMTDSGVRYAIKSLMTEMEVDKNLKEEIEGYVEAMKNEHILNQPRYELN